MESETGKTAEYRQGYKMATKQIQRTMQIVDSDFVVTLNIPGDGVNAGDLDKALQKVREMFFSEKSDKGAVSQCM